MDPISNSSSPRQVSAKQIEREVIIKSGLYVLAQRFTFGHTSKMFRAKRIHNDIKLNALWGKVKFQDDLIGTSRNIARKTVLAKKKDYTAAKKLLDLCKKRNKQDPHQNVTIDPHADPEKTYLGGICAGICIDNAYRHLIKGFSVKEIIEQDEKGGSKEAIANQDVYHLLTPCESKVESFERLLGTLQTMSQNHETQESVGVDFNIVGQACVQADPEIRLGWHYRNLSEKYHLSNDQPGDLPQLIKRAIKREKQALKSNSSSTWLEQKGSRFVIKDALAFKQAVILEINSHYNESLETKKFAECLKKREADVKALNWTVSLLQYKQALDAQEAPQPTPDKHSNPFWNSIRNFGKTIFGSKKTALIEPYAAITDPTMQYFIEDISRRRHNLYSMQAVANARGLQCSPLYDQFGHHAAYADDEAYLKNISKLPPGVYFIEFATARGRHAITYIKKSDKKGVLLDSNGFQVRCRDTAHTLNTFQTLLSFYSEKEKPEHSFQSGKPDHGLTFYKVEKES